MYMCEECAGLWSEIERKNAVKKGKWIATEAFNGRAGFHLNELYSPWSTLAVIVQDFLEAKNDPEKLKTWTNTTLGETWEIKGEEIEHSTLFARREYYAAQVPQAACVLTAAIDVQDDRLECGVEAWASGEENWKIDYRVFYGDPSRPELWKRARDFLDTRYQHESGNSLGIACACVDSGGHYTEEVYKFVKPMESRRVYAIKGKESDGTFVNSPTRNNNQKVLLFSLGVDTAKEVLAARLKILEPGSGYQHFPMGDVFGEEYFQGLTAEMCVTEKVRGVAKRVWVKKRPRNEPWDLAVYNLAAMYILKPNFKKVAARLATKPDAEPEEVIEEKPRPTTKKRLMKRKRKNWATDI
jgi:phage terminase large subunit GpA-like protein